MSNTEYRLALQLGNIVSSIYGRKHNLRQVEKVIEIEFIPYITGGITCNKDERMLITCYPKLGGLGILKLA